MSVVEGCLLPGVYMLAHTQTPPGHISKYTNEGYNKLLIYNNKSNLQK